MKSEIKILKLLISRKEENFTIKKIAENTKINYRIAYETIILLEKEGLISINKSGNSKICKFTNKFNSKVFDAEYERKQELFKNKDFLVIHNRLAELKFSFIVMLFGSHVKGKANKHSDIDILAIGGNEKEIRMTLSLFPEKSHLTYITYEEFIHMERSKEFSVVSEALKNNIVLIGIEEYYRLLKNAE
ncbi:nucleotidyltransferase domain-containing protein [Candidatus Woesearchaeota archaeon]|nr:nucleotidyltransferase domain-containing protein [Candidatus Woesearchaeota archaeon]